MGDSLGNFIKGVTQGAGDLVGSVTGAATGVVNMNMVYMALVPALLFLILTPGFILNVGGISRGRCAKLAPLPDDATDTCDFANGTYPGVDYTSLDPICAAQRKCHRWFVSGYTGPWPVALHTLVFLILAGALSYAMSSY